MQEYYLGDDFQNEPDYQSETNHSYNSQCTEYFDNAAKHYNRYFQTKLPDQAIFTYITEANLEFKSGQLRYHCQFHRKELSIKPLFSVNSKNLFYITDSSNSYKLLIDIGAGLSVFKPEICKTLQHR